MAMEGHARQLEQYAELQEKHITLLGKNRKIREGLVDLKKLAKKAGVTTMDTRWFECQAEQLVAMRKRRRWHCKRNFEILPKRYQLLGSF
jgi:kinesin family protein 15